MKEDLTFIYNVCLIVLCVFCEGASLHELLPVFVTRNTFLHLVSERKIQETHGKNIADDRHLSRSGFTAVPQQSAWMSWVEGSGRRLFEETSLAQ